MKKVISTLLLLIFISATLTGCVVDRDKKALKERYMDNSNYITITGEIVSVSQSYKQTATIDNWVIYVEIEYPISDEFAILWGGTNEKTNFNTYIHFGFV